MSPLIAQLCSLAFASGLDADGQGMPVHAGRQGQDGLLVSPPRLGQYQVALGLQASFLDGALVRRAGEAEEVLVDDTFGARLQGAVGLTPTVAVELDAPMRLAARSEVVGAAGLGDATLGVWWASRSGPLAVRGSLGLPTGAADRYAGSKRLVPAIEAVAETDGPLQVGASLGLGYEGSVEEVEAVGGLVAAAGARASWTTGALGLGLSTRTTVPLASVVRARRGIGAEVGVSGGWAFGDNRLHLTLGRGLTNAAGNPVWRASLGFVTRLGKEAPPPPVPMGSVQVVDPTGQPVAGARLTFEDGAERFTDAQGRASWIMEMGGPAVSATGLVDASISRRGTEILELAWAPVTLRVQVATATGRAVTPRVFLKEGPALSLEEGRYAVPLTPGTQTLIVEAEGYGRQARTVVVHPRRVEDMELEVVLLEQAGDAELSVEVSDPQGIGVRGAEVRLDGVAIGTVDEGRVAIGGLAEETTQVEVGSRYFVDRSVDVDLTGGSGTAEVGLFYAPGTVRITAEGPAGPIPDGLIYIDGPRSLPSVHLGERGEKLIQLSEGTWDLALSSPSYGLQERAIEVVDEGPVPLTAAFRLFPDQEGEAELVLRMRDVEGRPLEDVEVLFDGMPVGRTGTGGELRLFGLPVGEHVVGAGGQGLIDADRSLSLREGPQVASMGLGWEDGAVRVSARSAEGPVDAQVDFVGPERYDGGPLGDGGRRLFEDVPPGEWEVLATHPEGMEVAWATVGGRDGRLTDVEIALGDDVGDGVLEVAVVDPRNRPISGASVWLDGVRLVETASAGRVRLSNIATGARRLEIQHPTFASSGLDLQVSEDTSVRQQMAWRPGLVDVRVTSPDGPVTDARVYLSGPVDLDPVDLGADGQAILALEPGGWDLLVSSASMGLGERTLEVGSESREPVDMVFQLGTTGTLVTVLDRRGRPVPAVDVLVAGTVVGQTGSSGTLVVELPDGGAIAVRRDGIRDVDAVPIEVGEREKLVEVDYEPREVQVTAQHAGQPVTVELHANGPGRVAPQTLDGTGTFSLPPGRWEVLASAEELGTTRRFVEVPVDGEIEPVVFELEDARVRQTAEGLELVDVKFELGSDDASDAFAPVLEEIASTIIADPSIARVEVQGHTDPTGGTRLNFDLSRRRAATVVQALVELGVPPDMLEARGYGPSRPLVDNSTSEGRAVNRRVDFKTVLVVE